MDLNIAKKIIDMSLEVAEEHRIETEEYNLSKGRDANHMVFGAEDLFAMYNTPNPKRDLLREYVMSLDVEVLRDLVATMYAGRGDAPYENMREHVKSWDHNGCAMKLLEKAPLAKYLQKGLGH